MFVQVRRDSTLTWNQSENPKASMFHSPTFSREYYLYVRAGSSIQFNLSLLEEGQKDRIKDEMKLYPKVWTISGIDTDFPVLTVNADATIDQKLRIADYDRVILIRRPKTANRDFRLLMDYRSKHGEHIDTVSVSQGSHMLFSSPPDRSMKLHSISVLEPDLYNHPSVISGLEVGSTVYEPVIRAVTGEVVEKDYPFVQSKARFVFRRPLKIREQTGMTLRYRIFDKNAQLNEREISFSISAPDNGGGTVPTWLFILILAMAALLGCVLWLASRRGKRDSSEVDVSALQSRIDGLQKDLQKERILNEGNKGLLNDARTKVRTLQEALNGLQSEKAALLLKNASLQEGLSKQQALIKEEKEPVSFDKGIELLHLTQDFFDSLAKSDDNALKAWLIPLSFSWDRLVSEMDALVDERRYDLASGQGVLVRYLEDEDSCLNTIIRLNAYRANPELSAVLKDKGVSFTAVWWPYQIVCVLLSLHAIKLKEPPALLSDRYGRGFDPAKGTSMLLSHWSTSYASLPDMTIYDIGKAGYIISGGNETNYSVFYYIEPRM